MRRVLGVAAALAIVPVALALAATTHEIGTSVVTFTNASPQIAAGDSVRWTNTGGGNHNVVFEDGQRNGAVAPGQWTYTRTFDAAGTYRYYCEQHGSLGAGMSGTVTVVDATATATATPSATSTPDPYETPTPAPTPTATATPNAAEVPSLTGLAVQRRAKGGRVRGSAAAGPAGATLIVTVRAGGRAAGQAHRKLTGSGRVGFTVRLSRAARKRLTRSGSLRIGVTARVTLGDLSAGDAVSRRVRR